eukprot:906938_1
MNSGTESMSLNRGPRLADSEDNAIPDPIPSPSHSQSPRSETPSIQPTPTQIMHERVSLLSERVVRVTEQQIQIMVRVHSRFENLRAELAKREAEAMACVQRLVSGRVRSLCNQMSQLEIDTQTRSPEDPEGESPSPSIVLSDTFKPAADIISDYELDFALQCACFPAGKLLTVREGEELEKMKREHPKLVSAKKKAERKVAKAKTRRWRTEVLVPTDFTMGVDICEGRDASGETVGGQRDRQPLNHAPQSGEATESQSEVTASELLGERTDMPVINQRSDPIDETLNSNEQPEVGNVQEILGQSFESSTSDICSYSDFSLVWSSDLMKKYVEQQGPNCAAAVVAGCLNVALGDGVEPCSLDDVIGFYRSIKRNKTALHREERPSTGCIGNPALRRALLHCALIRGSGVSSRVLVGRHPPQMGGSRKGKSRAPQHLPPIALSLDDSVETIEKQWSGMRERFSTPGVVLIYHLDNHYALIYALRQWVNARGKPVRQLLTATHNQAPSAWVPFATMRDVVIRSKIYCVIEVSRFREPNPEKISDEKCPENDDTVQAPISIQTPDSSE